ncbi:unnamed protein product [Brachionus calyciflorus]|uniref:Uncharacterized protein n=1 Tax=Brachionus calyciflorus TaxID=104777 RepID=A0A813M1A9_9BILA|nr:unnamed protein product [Brachionus calyciflorus]
MLLNNDSPNFYTNNNNNHKPYMSNLKNSSLSLSVSSASSNSTSSTSFRPTLSNLKTKSASPLNNNQSSHQLTNSTIKNSPKLLSDRFISNHFNSNTCQPSSFSYNPNRMSSYDNNENLYENSHAFWKSQDKEDKEVNLNYSRKRSSIACSDQTNQKNSLINRALNYASLQKNSTSSWRAKLGKYLPTSNSTLKKSKKTQQQLQDGCDIALDDDIYSSYHLTRKNPINLTPKSSNSNILVSSSSSSSSSSTASSQESPKHKQKSTIQNGFNSLRKILKIKSTSKQSLKENNYESQTLQCKKGSKQIKKQLSFSQPPTTCKNDSSVFKMYKNMFTSRQDSDLILNSTRNDSSCLKLNSSCFLKYDSSNSTIFNNILSSSPISNKLYDQPPENTLSPNVKVYDGYRSLIKQIEDLKLSPEKETYLNMSDNDDDLKCDLEVASFFTKTIKCQAVNNYFSSNDLMNYDYSQNFHEVKKQKEEEDDAQNLDILVKQLVAEVSLSNFNFDKKMNSTEENYENLDFDKNSFDLSEYVDEDLNLNNSSPRTSSESSLANSYENEFDFRYYKNSNSLGPSGQRLEPVLSNHNNNNNNDTKTIRSINYFYPESSSHDNSSSNIKLEKRIRLNYRRPQNGYTTNANYLNFGTLC